GWPASPKPPMSTVEPSEILATASAAVSTIFVISFPLLSGVFVFNHHGNTLAHANNPRRQTPAASFSLHSARQGTSCTATRSAQWVAQCNGTTPGVHTFIIQGNTPRI